jgi:hypothetical protein
LVFYFLGLFETGSYHVLELMILLP